MTRAAIFLVPLVPLVLLGSACTKAPARAAQVAAPAAFAPNAAATPDANRRALPSELRGSGPGRPSGPSGAVTTLASTATPPSTVQVPLRTATTGPCPDPQLVLSTITNAGNGNVSWTFLVTADCALGRLALNIREATDRGTDPQCFTQEAMHRERVAESGWTDMPCSQIGYPPGNSLIEGWWYEPAFLPPGVSETRVTIVHRNTPETPPGLPMPVGLLFTWSWDGGPPQSRTWDALPSIGRSVEPTGETITRLLPLPARG